MNKNNGANPQNLNGSWAWSSLTVALHIFIFGMMLDVERLTGSIKLSIVHYLPIIKNYFLIEC
jgi:hypothetical protein